MGSGRVLRLVGGQGTPVRRATTPRFRHVRAQQGLLPRLMHRMKRAPECHSGTPLSFVDSSRNYSSGSTLTIEAPWLLPTHRMPGFLESSMKTRRMLVGRGIWYSVYWPVAISRRDTRSVSMEPVQASPFLPAMASYGADHGVGTFHSEIFAVFESNMPIALPSYSANQSRS